VRERIADQRFPNLPAEQFLMALAAKCGAEYALEAKGALDAVRRAERLALVERAKVEILKRGMWYHDGPTMKTLKGKVVNGTVVEAVLYAEIGEEP